MSRILLAYVVTEELFDTFRRTVALQAGYARALHGTDSLLVSDVPVSGLDICNIVVSDLGSGKDFCLAAGLNAALNCAAERDFDWLLLLDADTILVSHPNDFPPSGFGPCQVWKLGPTDIPELHPKIPWEESGPLLLGRNVFSKYRYCEEFKGYGYEDTDFYENVIGGAGIGRSFTDARTFHLWHPPRPTRRSISNYELFLRRKQKAIALVAHNRPDYLRQVLQCLAAAKGIEQYKLFCGIDPGCEEVEEICREVDFVDCEVVVNPARFGINYNNRRIIQHAFSKGAGLVVVVEDDILLSPDALPLCDWFYRWENRDGFLLMTLFAGDSSLQAPLRVEQRRHFCPWGWCITKKKYEEWVQGGWMCDVRGWDFSINCLIEREPSLKVLTPTLSRARNIGRFGVNETPDHHDATFSRAVYSDGSYTGPFEFLPTVPLNYEEIHDRMDVIKGWLVPEHGRWLFDTARSLPDGSSILEIGCYLGRSTAVLGHACLGSRKKVYCVDTWNGNDTDFQERDYFHLWKRNMAANCLLSHLTPFAGTSEKLLEEFAASGKRFSLTFIDGCHVYEAALRDFEMTYELTEPGGWIAMHDVHFTWPGPERVWHEQATKRLTSCGYIDGLAFGRKPS